MAEKPKTPRRSTRQSTGGTPVPPSSERRSTRPAAQRSTRRESAAVPNKPRLDRFKLIAIMFLLIGISLLSYQPIINNMVGPAQLDKAYANNLTADDMADNLARYQRLSDPDTGDGSGSESTGDASGTDPEKDIDFNAISETPAEREAREDLINSLFDPASIETIETLAVNPTFNKQNVIGAIYAPAVEFKIPIMYGLSQEILLTSAGTMKKSMTMGEGNYALIGHHSRNPNALFAPTHRLKPGNAVYVTDKKNVYEYKVIVNTVVSPKDIHVINDVPGRSILTLISCTDDSLNRVVIQAELVETVPFADSEPFVIKALNNM